LCRWTTRRTTWRKLQSWPTEHAYQGVLLVHGYHGVLLVADRLVKAVFFVQKASIAVGIDTASRETVLPKGQSLRRAA